MVMVQLVIASAVDLRRRWPASAPSPNSSPALSTETTAVLPSGDVTDSLTRPLSMYITPAQRSPCAKMVESASNLTLVVATCRDSRRLPPIRSFARVLSVVIRPPRGSISRVPASSLIASVTSVRFWTPADRRRVHKRTDSGVSAHQANVDALWEGDDEGRLADQARQHQLRHRAGNGAGRVCAGGCHLRRAPGEALEPRVQGRAAGPDRRSGRLLRVGRTT